MARIVGQAADAQWAPQILRFAVQTYPKDASAQFDLALALEKQPSEQIGAFRRAFALDPDMVAAYQSLGATLYSAGKPQQAIDTFRQGLRIDPLSAILYYDLLRSNSGETNLERLARSRWLRS